MITALGLGTKQAPENVNLDPQRQFWSWLRAFLHPDENGDSNAHQRAYFSGFACTQTSPAGMSIQIGGTNTPDSAVLVVAPAGKPVLLSTDGTPQTVTIPTAPASGSRIDAVVSYIDTTSADPEAETPGTPEYVHTIVVSGTASSSPSAPTNAQIVSALPAGAGGTYYRWCDVKVTANQTTITNSNITDRKPASPNLYSATTETDYPLIGTAGPKVHQDGYQLQFYRIGHIVIAWGAVRTDQALNTNDTIVNIPETLTRLGYINRVYTLVPVGSSGTGLVRLTMSGSAIQFQTYYSNTNAAGSTTCPVNVWIPYCIVAMAN